MMMKYKVRLVILVFSLMHFYVNGQNVGIGLTNPLRAKLEVNGVAGTGTTSAIFGGESTGLSMQRNWPTIGFNQYRDITTAGSQGKYMANGFAAIQYLNPTNGTMVFDMFPNGTLGNFTPASVTSLVLLTNGNVGIRSFDNDASLHIGRGAGSFSTAVIDGTDYASYFNYSSLEYTYIRSGIAGGYVYINDVPDAKVVLGFPNGIVGINTANAVGTLDIHQTTIGGFEKGLVITNSNLDRWEFFNSLNLFFKFNGNARASIDYQDGHYGQLSDVRVKKNIEPMPKLLEKVMALEPVSYQMKDAAPDQKKSLGFIAQDVQKYFPEVVTIYHDANTMYDTISDLHMMDYGAMSVVAIKAIQEQQKLIEQLQEEVKVLKEQNQVMMEARGKRRVARS